MTLWFLFSVIVGLILVIVEWIVFFEVVFDVLAARRLPPWVIRLYELAAPLGLAFLLYFFTKNLVIAIMAASPFWLPYGLWGIWLVAEWLKDKTKRKLDRLELVVVSVIVFLVYVYTVLDPSQTISQIVANWIGVGWGAVGGCFAGIVMVYLAMKGVSRESRPFTWATIGVVLGWLASAIVFALFFDWFVQFQSLASSYFEGRPQWLWAVTFLVFCSIMGVVNGLGAIRSTETVKQ